MRFGKVFATLAVFTTVGLGYPVALEADDAIGNTWSESVSNREADENIGNTWSNSVSNADRSFGGILTESYAQRSTEADENIGNTWSNSVSNAADENIGNTWSASIANN
ncbi:hypothetical protein HYFRA_00003753 [Hymenoscyphus fraxineus]|uniref:Uncharacterized protein n=1 Tax=Hymenoscyphus fraxineus TaxID=746836 RepID=A0A9N9L0G1_9HELO|nr:hypothetical protein HYFRA_00003753 [Hymenoscyphus fraxineus]